MPAQSAKRTYMNRTTAYLSLLFFPILPSFCQKSVTITVENPTAMQRQEIVELAAEDVLSGLGRTADSGFIIKNAAKTPVTHQTTHDGKILFEACVQPFRKAKYTISTSKEASPKDTIVCGALYRQRLDDIAWENDFSAYRIYGPALQATGEKAYGIDIWTKSVPHPVVAQRYRKNKYHKDDGTGLDCYNVGPSLGCGTSALIIGDSLVMPYCYKDFRILDNGPLRFTVELTYPSFSYGGDTQVTEHRIISLDKGSHFNRMTLWYEGLSHTANMASGIVIHQSDTTNISLEKDYILYADPTDNAARHNSQIYVALLFPQHDITPRFLVHPDIKDIAGHAVGISPYHPGKRKTYYFGSAWSKYDIRTLNAWKLHVRESLYAYRHPLHIIMGSYSSKP